MVALVENSEIAGMTVCTGHPRSAVELGYMCYTLQDNITSCGMVYKCIALSSELRNVHHSTTLVRKLEAVWLIIRALTLTA